MAYTYTPQKKNIYLPKAGAYQSAWNARNRAAFGGSSNVFGQNQFVEPEGKIFVEGGRAGVKGGDLVSDLIRAPAHMIEAPLRPLNVLTDGGVGEAIGGAYQGVKSVPVLHQALSGVEGTVGVLEAENKAVRARLNQPLAQALAASVGKMPNERVEHPKLGEKGMTVGELRSQVMKVWDVNEYTGEPFTLEQLEQLAIENPLGFGEFASDANGVVGFVKEMLLSPTTYAFGTGLVGAGLRAAGRGARATAAGQRGAAAAGRAASWAQPIRAPLGRAANLPRIGRGALRAIRPDFVAEPEFLGVKKFLEGTGRLGSLTLGGLLRAGQKVYFPGYAALRRPRLSQLGEGGTDYLLQGGRTGAGMGRAQAAATSWMRGGLQQMVATTGVEHAMNIQGEREYDEEGGVVTPANGFSDSIQDLLHAINNDHPMSNSDTFTILALFSPWPSAVGAAWKGIRNRRINPEAYFDDATLNLRRTLEKEYGGKFKNNDDFLTQLGRGNKALGSEILEYFTNYADIMLVENQLSGFTNSAVATIEGKLHRQAFMQPQVNAAVIGRRETGALRPKSTAEFIIRLYREGESRDMAIRTVQGRRTITPQGLLDGLFDKFHADAQITELLGPTLGVVSHQGQTVTREIMDGIRNDLHQLADDVIVPRETASMLIEKNPWLMHQTEFWHEFALTLGQIQRKTGLTKGRAALPEGTEGITVRELKERIDDYMDELPPESELFHEPAAAQRQVLSKSEARKALGREPASDYPARMASYRERYVTKATNAMTLRNKIIRVRSREFNKNGTPRFGTAKTLRGHFGGLFQRAGEKIFSKKAPPIELTPVDTPYSQTILPVRKGVFPSTPGGTKQLDFLGNDLDAHTLPVSKAFEANIGNREVYIFQPVKIRETVFKERPPGKRGGKRPREEVETVPEIYKTIPEYGAIPQLSSLRPDRWYVARKDGNGLLMTNTPFSSHERAANWVHEVSPSKVTVEIDQGVFNVDGHTVVRKPGPLMTAGEAASFEVNMGRVLDGEVSQWRATGRREVPGTMVRTDSTAGQMPNGSVLDSVNFYFTGDDGLPAGMLGVDRINGAADELKIYVQPDHRGRDIATELYNEAFRQGVDLSNISGINNTAAGRTFTDKYWANRRDTIDTEGLQLAVENGGRITEVSIHDPITTNPNIRDMGSGMMHQDANEALEMLASREGYKGPSGKMSPNELLEAYNNRDLGMMSYEYNGKEVLAITDWRSPSAVAAPKRDLILIDEAGNVSKIQKAGSEFDDDIRSLLDVQPVELTPGGVQHADTLARWGFHEVARYGDRSPAPVTFVGRDARFAEDIFNEMGYIYRIDKIASLDRIRKSGLEAGLTHADEAYGSYFAIGADDASRLVPPRIGEKSLILRVKRSGFIEGRLDDARHADELQQILQGKRKTTRPPRIEGGDIAAGRFPGEMVVARKLKPDEIEYFGMDDKWHSLSETGEKAVFAYRGGDTTQAIFNSRIEGANPPYKPTDRRVTSRDAALNIARKRANDASLAYPTMDTLGRGYTNSRRFFSPEERRLHLNELADDLERQSKSAAESIQWFDDTVETISGLKKVTSMDGYFERAMPEEINALVPRVKRFNEDWPGLQMQEGGPIWADPRSERFGHLLTTHSMLQRFAYDYGWLSPISRFFDAFEPHSSVYLSQEARRELETQMSAVGLTSKQIDRFYEGIRETIMRSRSAEGVGSLIGSYKYRNARAIEEGELRAVLRDAGGEASEQAVLGRFGSVHRMITESSAGMLRRAARKARQGGKIGKLEAAMNGFFRSWQYDPQLRGLSGATHQLSKFYYPLIRFRTDPMFAAMNLIEPYMYNISRHGISNQVRKRARHQQQMNERVFRESQRSNIPAGGFSEVEKLPIEILLQDSGMFTMPRNIKNPMLADYEVTRVDQLRQYLKDIPENDPLARLFQERFGAMSGDNWARGMEDVMYGFMDESMEGISRKQFVEYFDELGFTQADVQRMSPFVNRIQEMYRGMADDMVDLYIGRMRRSHVERIMDSFWLFWPSSYIVKATTWLANIMTKRVGGMDIGAGGLFLYEEYRNRFLRAVEHDADLQNWMKENRDFLFLLEMLFPITPESIGVSLNPGVRIAASWANANTINAPELEHRFGDYSYIESVPEGVERTVRFGPIRTWNLFRRLMNSFEVPGWTYGSSGSGGRASPVSRADMLPSFRGGDEQALTP